MTFPKDEDYDDNTVADDTVLTEDSATYITAAADRLILDDATTDSMLISDGVIDESIKEIENVDDTKSIKSQKNVNDDQKNIKKGGEEVKKDNIILTSSDLKNIYGKVTEQLSGSINTVKDLLNKKDKLSIITSALHVNTANTFSNTSPLNSPKSIYEVNHYKEPLFVKSPSSLQETSILLKRTVKTVYHFVSPRPHLSKDQYDFIIDHILDCFWKKYDRRMCWKIDAAIVLQKYRYWMPKL